MRERQLQNPYGHQETDDEGFRTFTINGKRFRVMGVNEIVAKPIEWWLDELIPAYTVTILAGYGGCGKSTAAIAWSAEEVQRGGKVLYLHTEGDRERTYKPQLDVLGVGGGGVEFVDAMESAWTFPDDLDALTVMVREFGITMIVLDPIVSFTRETVNHSSNNEVRTFLEPLTQWANDHEVTILGITHFNKATDGGSNKVTGSRAWVDVPRSTLTFAKSNETGQGVVSISKTNLATRSVNLSYTIESAPLVIAGEAHRAARLVWGGEVNITSDQIDAENADYGKVTANGVERCHEWLSRVLANGPMKQSDIYELNKGKGGDHYSDSQLRTGRGKVAESKKSPEYQGAWFWKLPEHDWPWDSKDATFA